MDKDEIIAFHDYVCQVAGIRELPVVFKDVKSYGGKARLDKDKNKGDIIYAEATVRSDNEAYQESVVIHEIAHFINYWDYLDHYLGGGCQHHGRDFKNIERDLLKQFGMTPAYGGKYAVALFGNDGEVLWSNPRR